MIRTQNKGNYMTMPSKLKIWGSFLLIIMVAGMLCACGSPAPEAPSTSDDFSGPADSLEVVYFHRAQRCQSCVWVEAATAYTLSAYFRDEMDSGKIIYRVVNGEEKENAAIVKKYGASGSSLFINRIIDGTDHIEQASDLWVLIGDNEAFPEALRDRIKQSLEGKK